MKKNKPLKHEKRSELKNINSLFRGSKCPFKLCYKNDLQIRFLSDWSSPQNYIDCIIASWKDHSTFIS